MEKVKKRRAMKSVCVCVCARVITRVWYKVDEGIKYEGAKLCFSAE